MSDPVARAYMLLDAQDRAGAKAQLKTEDGAEAAGLLGELLLEDGQAVPAATALRRAVADVPDHIPWRRALIAALIATGNGDEAAEHCHQLLARRPDDAATLAHMARLSLDAGDRAAALAYAREAGFLARGALEIVTTLALVMIDADEGLPAVEMLDAALRKAHAADTGAPMAWTTLGKAWQHLGEREKAGAAWRQALELDPSDRAGAGALFAGLAATEVPTSLPQAFVRALFDTYADRFDRELVGKLRYDAPQALRQLLLAQGAVAGLRILDAGCGTGLAGVQLRDMAAYLAGFDLSPRMVEKARERKIYDALWVGDLIGSMSDRPGSFDLVIAADVFVYVGDLRATIIAAATALAPAGRLAFTCERTQELGFQLHEGRRFAHSEAHIREVVAAAGLTLIHLADHSTRIDRGNPVPGWIALATKA